MICWEGFEFKKNVSKKNIYFGQKYKLQQYNLQF